jgi:hypothetical protein
MMTFRKGSRRRALPGGPAGDGIALGYYCFRIAEGEGGGQANWRLAATHAPDPQKTVSARRPLQF